MKIKQVNIELKQLSVGYEQSGDAPLEVLKDLNLTASPGEMVALIGSNGIGKSTLLRTLAAFQPELGGKIEIGGRNINELNVREISRVISFVSTESIRTPNLSVFDLVAYGRFPYTNWIGVLTAEDKSVVRDAIEKVGLRGFENRLVTQISDGERQRAMIARALAQDTPVIILDEPTAYLDVSNKYEIFHLLQVLAEEKTKTILLSTHDLNIALREVDKLWIITETGSFQGAPEDAVLNGWLGRMFQNPHIGFDENDGEFFFKKNFKTRVKVEGEGNPLIWTIRALNRKGYQIVTKSEAGFTVVAGKNSWILKAPGIEKELTSIYRLLAELA